MRTLVQLVWLSALIVGVWIVALPLTVTIFCLVVASAALWIARSFLASRTHPILDAFVSVLSILVFFWVLPFGIFAALWCFGLTQLALSFFPRSLPTLRIENANRFDAAERCAAECIARLSQHV